jgi:uncharacterized protein (TIGR00251 family)
MIRRRDNLTPGTPPGEISFRPRLPENPMQLPGYLIVQPDGVQLSLKVQPRASANALVGLAGNELKVKVTAPPVDAAANEALVRLLAECFGIPRNRVELLRGNTSRHKVVKLYGLKLEAAMDKLRSAGVAG